MRNSTRHALLLTVILGVCVTAAAGILYWPSLEQPFHFDDQIFLRDDNVRLGRWWAFLFPPASRCLTWLTFLVQYRAVGPSPASYHATNLVLHVANSDLIFVLLLQLLAWRGRRDAELANGTWTALAAAAGAMVFALHPVQSESVLLVYQRSTLLAAFFGFLGLNLWVYPKRLEVGPNGGLRTGFETLAGVCFLLAVAAKEWAVVLPFLFWLCDRLLEGHSRISKRLPPLLALGVVAGVAMALSGSATGQLATSNGPGGALSYLAAQIRVFWLYGSLVLGIGDNNIDHHVPASGAFPGLVWWLALAGLAALGWALWRVRRRDVTTAFFGFAFLLFLVPSSSLLPSHDLAFEHRLYASMLGTAGLFAVFILKLAELSMKAPVKGGAGRRIGLPLLATTVCALLTLTALGTSRRIAVWGDSVTLWRDAVAKSPHKYRPNYNLGVLLLRAQPGEADRYLSRAIEIDPSQPAAYRSLGEARLRLGMEDQAERLWKQALLLAPNDFDTLLALGKLDRRRRRYFEAKRRFQAAERIRPTAWEVHYQLGSLQQDFGFLPGSVPSFERALELNPLEPALYYALAEPTARMENWDRAIELYQQGLALEPRDAEAHYRLALIYRRVGKMGEAEAEVKRGIEVSKTPAEIAAGRKLLGAN